MTGFRLTPKAARDLDGIAVWTARNWGADQMDAYVRRLNVRLHWLALNPLAGRDRSDVGPGYRSYPQGQHLIFYIIQPEHIAIIGVPHQAMDVDSYFS